MSDACYDVSAFASTMCAPAGTAARGDACTSARDCRKDDVCSALGATQTHCVARCNPDGGAPACGTGTCWRSTPDYGACL